MDGRKVSSDKWRSLGITVRNTGGTRDPLLSRGFSLHLTERVENK
jgi:hypothetical protein